MISGSWKTQALYVAAELRIFDWLAEAPQTSASLSDKKGSSPAKLQRLLRALTTLETCRETDDGSFEITSLGELLVTDNPASLRSVTLWWGRRLWPLWSSLLDSFKSEVAAQRHQMGPAGYQHLAEDPAAASLFNQMSTELTRLVAPRILASYDFSGNRRIMDLGGGGGEMLCWILRSCPKSSGILFDLPHAIEDARCRFEEMGLATRCDFVAGDFFDRIPSGADLVLLKSVLHNWDDERSSMILDNVRRALADGGKVLIIEHLLPKHLDPRHEHQALAFSDLTMLLAHSGRERTEEELQHLLQSTGFRITRILSNELTPSLIEAVC